MNRDKNIKNIVCLIKFVPDVGKFVYDYEQHILVRESSDLILNPDDVCAVSYALKFKQSNPDTMITVVTMGPLNVQDELRNLLRVGVDNAVLISDKIFAGSDTYATSLVLGKYLSGQSYDLILTGTHTLDGDTSHIPSQVAQYLNLPQISGINNIESLENSAVVHIEQEHSIVKAKISLPAILGISSNSKYKLPFVRFADLEKYVDDRLYIITNVELGFSKNEIGLAGSLTKVVVSYPKKMERKSAILVLDDDAGVDAVYGFLSDRGYING